MIDNLAADSEHYARATLTVRVSESDALWAAAQAALAADPASAEAQPGAHAAAASTKRRRE